MTLLVAFNDTVLVDSCTSIGGTLTSVNKVIQYKGLTYACSGSPDVAHMCVGHSMADGTFDATTDMVGLPCDGTCILLRQGSAVWSMSLDSETSRWIRLSNEQKGAVQWASGSGAETFLALVASGMDVVTAFDKTCDINPFVDRPVRRF